MVTNQQVELLTKTRLNLKRKGWSLRAAAPFLGVSVKHLSLVLNGKRKSLPLLKRIEMLPPRRKTPIN